MERGPYVIRKLPGIDCEFRGGRRTVPNPAINQASFDPLSADA
jgi:hypothetical protein